MFCRDSSDMLWQRRPRLHLNDWRTENCDNFYKNEMATYLQNRVLKRSPNSAVQWWKLLKWWSIKDIPLACWSSKTFQDKIDPTLDLRPQNLKHDCKWPLKTYFNKQAWTSSAKHEGNEWHNPLHQSYGMSNEMQLIKTDGTPNHEMQKRFDLWRRDN